MHAIILYFFFNHILHIASSMQVALESLEALSDQNSDMDLKKKLANNMAEQQYTYKSLNSSVQILLKSYIQI